jgi:hypothetical protein
MGKTYDPEALRAFRLAASLPNKVVPKHIDAPLRADKDFRPRPKPQPKSAKVWHAPPLVVPDKNIQLPPRLEIEALPSGDYAVRLDAVLFTIPKATLWNAQAFHEAAKQALGHRPPRGDYGKALKLFRRQAGVERDEEKASP